LDQVTLVMGIEVNATHPLAGTDTNAQSIQVCNYTYRYVCLAFAFGVIGAFRLNLNSLNGYISQHCDLFVQQFIPTSQIVTQPSYLPPTDSDNRFAAR
jgi:hypothetical protein